MGKKQFALLLLLFLTQQSTATDVHDLIQQGTFRTTQAALNKLVAKGLLGTHKKGSRLFYSLSDAGRAAIDGCVRCLCDRCLTLGLVRELHR